MQYRWTMLVAGIFATLGAQAATITVGTLPAADSVVLYVAQREKLFEKEGLDVNVIPFKSAIEVGAAMRADKLQGHFGDVMNVITQSASGVPQKIVVTTTYSHPAQRNFAFVTSPKLKGVTQLSDLKGNTSAMSSATIIDYLLDRMRAEEKLPQDAFKTVEVKQIPVRLQMLMAGQVDTALLPEPLVSLVAAKGGQVLWTDKNLNEPQAVVALKDSVADEKTVASFRRAVSAAAKLIEVDPTKYRAYMVQKGLLPPPLAQTYPMIRFSQFGTQDGLPPLPNEQDVQRVGQWMLEKGMIQSVPAYETIVAK